MSGLDVILSIPDHPKLISSLELFAELLAHSSHYVQVSHRVRCQSKGDDSHVAQVSAGSWGRQYTRKTSMARATLEAWPCQLETALADS